jgi:phospholipase/carboxylesterase
MIRNRPLALVPWVTKAWHAAAAQTVANIAAAMPLTQPCALAGAVLLRAAPHRRAAASLILSGAMDPIAPPASAAPLADAGAAVQHETVAAGHGSTRADIACAKAWLAVNSAAFVR